MRWWGGVLKPPDQERKKRLQRPASLEIRRYQDLASCSHRAALIVSALIVDLPFGPT
jgi:hypothetical protein